MQLSWTCVEMQVISGLVPFRGIAVDLSCIAVSLAIPLWVLALPLESHLASEPAGIQEHTLIKILRIVTLPFLGLMDNAQPCHGLQRSWGIPGYAASRGLSRPSSAPQSFYQISHDQWHNILYTIMLLIGHLNNSCAEALWVLPKLHILSQVEGLHMLPYIWVVGAYCVYIISFLLLFSTTEGICLRSPQSTTISPIGLLLLRKFCRVCSPASLQAIPILHGTFIPHYCNRLHLRNSDWRPFLSVLQWEYSQCPVGN